MATTVDAEVEGPLESVTVTLTSKLPDRMNTCASAAVLDTAGAPSDEAHEYVKGSPSGSLTPCAVNVKIVAESTPIPVGETAREPMTGARLAVGVVVGVGVPEPPQAAIHTDPANTTTRAERPGPSIGIASLGGLTGRIR